MWTSKVAPGILCELSWTQRGEVLTQLVMLTAWRVDLQCFVAIKSYKRLYWCWRKEGWGCFAATVLVGAWRYFQTLGKVWSVLGWGTLGCSQEEAAAGIFFPVSGSGMLLCCCPVTNESQIHLLALFNFLWQATKGAFLRQGSSYRQLLLIFSGSEYVSSFCNIFMQRRKSDWLCCVCSCESHHTLNRDAWKENKKGFQLF